MPLKRYTKSGNSKSKAKTPFYRKVVKKNSTKIQIVNEQKYFKSLYYRFIKYLKNSNMSTSGPVILLPRIYPKYIQLQQYENTYEKG